MTLHFKIAAGRQAQQQGIGPSRYQITIGKFELVGHLTTGETGGTSVESLEGRGLVADPRAVSKFCLFGQIVEWADGDSDPTIW
jgi:hypothetical protein